MYPGQGYQVHQGPPGGDQQQQQQSGPSMGGQPGMGGQGPTPGPVMGGQGPSTGPDQGQTFNMSAMSASLPPHSSQGSSSAAQCKVTVTRSTVQIFHRNAPHQLLLSPGSF